METTVFDEDGDITLLLDPQDDGSYAKHYIVSSKVMSLVSPVWKAMFSDKWRKTNEVPLPDDDPWALDFLLKLAHHQMPDCSLPSRQCMVKIAVICDKYDLIHLCPFYISR
jgi:hypothetical protein